MLTHQIFQSNFLVLIILLTSCSSISGQDVQLNFHGLTEENGLSQGDQYHLSKDSKGLIWIGTENGLLRFDGHQIKKYQVNAEQPNSLSENHITSACFEDQENNLWFTSSNAINCYRRITDDFVSYTHPSNTNSYHGFHLDNQGQFWVQIGNQEKGALYFFNIKSGTFEQSIPMSGNKCAVIKNDQGIISQLISYSLPNRPGLILINLENGLRKEVFFQTTSNGKNRFFSSPTKGVFVDSDNIIWVGVYDGLGRYRLGDDKGLIETNRNKSIDSDLGWVWDIAELDNDHLLVAADCGLLLFDKLSNTFIKQFRHNSSDKYSCPVKKPNSILKDSSNVLLLAGAQQEIAFAHLNKNRFSSLPELKNQYITGIAEDFKNNFWCSTLDSGTYVYNQNKKLLFRTTKIKNSTHPDGHSNITPLYFFIKKNQTEWWGNIGNTFLFWNSISEKFEFKLPYFFGVRSTVADKINYNYQLSDGKNLIAKGETIYELLLSQEKADTLPWHNIQYLQLSTINIIFEDQNKHLYIGDDQGRLVILKEQNGQLHKLADFKDVGNIYAFEEESSKKMLWFSGSKGLGKIHTESFESRLFNQRKDNIPEEAYYGIAVDKMGQFWLPGNNGLVRYHPETKAFHRFGIADGLLSAVFNKNTCITATQTGEIWLGGKSGVNVFKPEAIKLLNIKPNIQLSRFLVNDEAFEVEGNINEKEELTFDYEQNTLSFQFAALDYSDPNANTFRCQMIGHDEEPVEQGTRNFIRYGNLPAGAYTFKVWGSNSDGVFNETPFELDINITPPFYQTWWFYLLCTLAISGIIYGVFKYRLEQALKVERLRVKISSDLHDDVGGLLSGLAMQSEFLELTATEEAKPKLQQIAELSRSAMSRMRDTVWVIDARKDKLENLIDRMNEHAEEVLTPKFFAYKIQSEGLDLAHEIPADIRQSLYLIYKEAATNIAKHSNGNEVKVVLKKQGANFEMLIQDNGKVEEKKYKTTGLGMSNMKMRAKQIDAELELSTQSGFTIKVKRKAF